jgi:hypothetical protein
LNVSTTAKGEVLVTAISWARHQHRSITNNSI